MSFTCRICFNSVENKPYPCYEKMFGWGDEFTYFQCSQCSCLQISGIPQELERFYPQNYYSFHAESLPQKGLKSRLAARRDFSAATGTDILGKLLMKLVPARLDLLCLSRIPLRPEMNVLDVGCGRGQLLTALHRAGFRKLSGIDPYLAESVEVLPGLVVRKVRLEQMHETFDLIMLHHVFEHLESPLQTLESCRERLTNRGKILLRFPTADSEAWERYRENWVQLDAPRHLFLHTRRSVNLLAERAGLKIEQWWCDSTEFQFWGSDLYREGIALTTATDLKTYFSETERRRFRRRAAHLNRTGRGDQVVVVLSNSI